MKSQIFTIDFFIASAILVAVIVAILGINFQNQFPVRNVMDLAITLDDKGIFLQDEKTINQSLNGASAIVRCYKYTGTWDLDFEKIVINGNPKFWYRMIRVYGDDFCTIDVGK